MSRSRAGCWRKRLHRCRRRRRHLKNLVSAGPSPSAASPHASPALRMQRRRTNRGRGPATEFVSKCWIGRRGGLEDRLKRRDDRCFGPAVVTHDSSPERWLLLPDHRGPRPSGPRPGESTATSRGGCDAHGRTMMPRLGEDSATRGRPDRYPTTRRGRPGPGKYRKIHPIARRTRRDRRRHTATFEQAGETRTPAERLVLRGGRPIVGHRNRPGRNVGEITANVGPGHPPRCSFARPDHPR
jgi:hypothetical protein